MISITLNPGVVFEVTYPGRVTTTSPQHQETAAFYEEAYQLEVASGEIHWTSNHEVLLSQWIQEHEQGTLNDDEKTVFEPSDLVDI